MWAVQHQWEGVPWCAGSISGHPAEVLTKVGKVFRVLVDKAESGHYIARTEFDSPEVDNEVLIATKGNYLRVGDFVEARITEANEHDLRAEVA